MNGAALPYYKRFPRRFLEGTIGMDLEMKGAYSIVIDMIFMRGGDLPDNAQYIAGQLGCSVRKWNSIKEKLIDAGKLTAENGIISNKTADNLLIEQRSYQDKQAENRRKPNKNKATEKPPPTVREEVQKTDISKASALESARAKKSTGRVRGGSRATRIPEGWAPSPVDYAFATNEGLQTQETNREADKFRDYWIAQAGAKGRKVDWSATWRNWIRRCTDTGQPAHGSGTGGSKPARQSQPTNFADLRARLHAERHGDVGLQNRSAGGEMDSGIVIDGELAGDQRGDLFPDRAVGHG